NVFETQPLSTGGLAVLDADEINITTVNNVKIYENSSDTEHNDGQLSLTTLRLFYINSSTRKAIFLHLSKISAIEKKNSLFSSPKLNVKVNGSQHLIVFSFHKSGRDPFHDALADQLRKKNWLHVKKDARVSIPSNIPDQNFTQRAGITGIMKRVESEDLETKKSLTTAFSDLNSLMDKAKEMVELAEKFGEKVKKLDANNADAEEDSQYQELLVNLGISTTNIVSKNTAGARFHEQLARQLADFLIKPLQQKQGIMTLTDAFCLYNRARGTDLISPEDMYSACSMLDRLDLPMQLKQFDSKVIVIQLKSITGDAEIVKRINDLLSLQRTIGVTAVDVANAFNVSVALAKDHLLLVESKEVICRDESVQGLRFYFTIDCFPIQ
ncbi:vacuolar protein sorting protein VPS36, partial [Acrasis kona]